MMYSCRFTAPRAAANTLMALTEIHPDIAVDMAENKADETSYIFTFFVPDEHRETLRATLALHNIIPPEEASRQGLSFEPVPENVDYVALTREQFPPLLIGPFFIARNGETPPANAIGLAIAPNQAFGSGEHATTSGCLQAYLALPTPPMAGEGLDFGAGSGILAIAAARHSGRAFVCVDIDPASVAICAENAALNGVDDLVTSEEGHVPPAGQTYALVFANILLQPLLENAAALTAAVQPGGFLILSGFTADQAPQIEAKYSSLGLKKLNQFPIAEWMTHLWTRA